MKPAVCALFGAAVIAGAGAFSGTASAYDDGYQNVFSSVLTAVGLMKDDKSPEIDYRERAPLVLPPKMMLDKPVPAGASRTAAWPQDPDVLKRRREAEEARAPSANLLGNPNEVASKDELSKGRTTAGVSPNSTEIDRCGQQKNQRGCLVLSPDALAAEHEHYQASGMGDKSRDDVVAGVEPEREYLTQPPKGYMKTTKTVKATTEAPKVYHDESNPAAALVYHEKTDD